MTDVTRATALEAERHAAAGGARDAPGRTRPPPAALDAELVRGGSECWGSQRRESPDVACTVGNGNAFLYLDGVGVPASDQVQPDIDPADPFTPIAVTGVVPAGQHTLTIALDCPAGNKTGDSSSGDGKLGAVLIGG